MCTKEQQITLLNALILSSSFEEMMDLIYQLLESPAFVIDMGHNVLGYTKTGSNSKAWEDIVISGKLGHELLEDNLRLKAEHAASLNNSRAMLFVKTYNDENQIKKSLKSCGKTLGMLIVISREELTDVHLELTDLIGNIIAKKLLPDPGILHSTVIQQRAFLTSLLMGTVYSREQIQRHLYTLRIREHESLYVCVIQRETGRRDMMLEPDEPALLKEGIPFVYGNELILLLHRAAVIQNAEEELTELKQLLQSYGMCCGISSRFSDVQSMEHFYLQAVRALAIGKRLHRKQICYHFPNLILYDMLDQVPEELLKDYMHEDILCLQKYDIENQTFLCRTLHAYLDSNHSLTKTSRILYVHKNTVNYRIRQCEEIIGLSIKDLGFLAVQYKLSLDILEYQGQL